MTSLISLQQITFTYAATTRPVLLNLSLEVPRGQICAVIGRAGAGKSTLCALCAGFIPNFYNGQFSGMAVVDGQDVVQQSVSDLVRHVGLVSTNAFSQISGARFTLYEEVAFALENLGLPRAEIIERVDWALAATQLTDLRDRSPYALSGGQQQRMVLAATLAIRPPVLVLDEPTAQLDPPTIERLADILRGLARQGTTILFAEHRLEWTAALAERVLALDGGRIIADGSPESVLTNPLLLDRQIGWPRPAIFAAQAREAGQWPATRPLPVTVPALIAGLADQSTDHPAAETGAPGGVATALQAPPLAMPFEITQAHALSGAAAPIVELQEVRFSYPGGVEALRGVTFAVGAGERVALVGRNGAGKSTLVRHLNGLLQPSAGQARVASIETHATTVAHCARHVGIVFQDVRNQLFARSVRDELRFGPRNLGYKAAQVEALVERALDALDLRAVADEHPYDLPLAQRRLVAIAAVLAMDTAVLVLDEPTAGLDNAAVSRLTALVRGVAEQGKSVIVVSHDIDFCYEALQRVVLVRDGQIALDRSWDALAAHERAMLDTDVTLPIALRAGLERSTSTPLRTGARNG